ncbi:MAG: hypothetical protein ABFS46_14320, partial [Myxococcota bacterium]
LTIAEAPPIRTLLWNARGQTFWDCGPDSRWAIAQHLELAERCFRRAVLLDPCTYFPYVNLAHMAADRRDLRRVEYWVGELAGARKRMDEEMLQGLARYLDEAEWVGPVEEKRFWRNGPKRWLAEARRAGTLVVLLLALLLGAPDQSVADGWTQLPDLVAHGKGRGSGKRGGAGGN